MKLIFKNQRGIALLLVLSTLAVMTVALVDFAYQQRVNYHLAVNAKERLQAYYLAKSALNFSKIILKYNKDTQKLLDQMSEELGGSASGMVSEPFYKMFPLSSDTIREMITGGEIPAEPTADQEKSAEGTDLGEEIKSGVGMMAEEEAKKFLNFEGDFEAEISEEQTKFDLNRIASIVSTSPSYDLRKKLLWSLLLSPQFEKGFQNQQQDSEKLVHALSDWVDVNGVINEFDNVQRGSEESAYLDKDYKVKNAKLMTLSEIRLVEGMNDDIYENLKETVTVYSANNKINVCMGGNESLLSALIYHYTHHAGCTSPVDYTDEEKMRELRTAVAGGCPDIAAAAQALNEKLGLVDINTDSESDSTSSASSTVTGCAFQFEELLTSDNNVFTVRARGQVGDTQLTITVVLNAGGSDPTKWAYYYYRID